MSKNASKEVAKNGGGNAVYCLGLFGAFVYYMQQADNFGMVLFGIFKALTWPGFLVYEALKALGA